MEPTLKVGMSESITVKLKSVDADMLVLILDIYRIEYTLLMDF